MGYAAAIGARENSYEFLVGSLKGISLGQPWLKWENNIKIDPKEIYLIDVE